MKSDCVHHCVRAQTWTVPGRQVLPICYSCECSCGPEVTYISHVWFRCMQSHENLFSVRILFSIIHEQLTEFTCDLLRTVYKYSPYVCLSIKKNMMHNKNYMKTSVHQKMSIYEPCAFYSTIKIDKIRYRSKKCQKPLLHLRSKHYLKIYKNPSKLFHGIIWERS